jgi:hypothetical protein
LTLGQAAAYVFVTSLRWERTARAKSVSVREKAIPCTAPELLLISSTVRRVSTTQYESNDVALCPGALALPYAVAVAYVGRGPPPPICAQLLRHMKA